MQIREKKRDKEKTERDEETELRMQFVRAQFGGGSWKGASCQIIETFSVASGTI